MRIAAEVVQPIHHCVVAARGADARGRRAGRLASPGHRPVRALPARAARPARRSGAPSTADAVLTVRDSRSRGAALGSRLAAELYGCHVIAGGCRGPARQRDPLRLAAPARTPWARSAGGQDVDRLLGRRRPVAGLARGRAGRVRGPRRQPDEDRIAAAAGRAWATTCSSSISRARPTRRGSARRSTAIARPRRRAARTRLVPDRPGSGYTDPTVAVRVSVLRTEPGDSEPGPALALPGAGRPAQRATSTGRVLVLNASYEPINVCTVRRAAVLILKNRAEILEKSDWALHSETLTLARPVVIRLLTYVRIPRDAHRRKITRRAVFARDRWTCQYCGHERGNLTVDHVIPRSKGGRVELGEHRRPAARRATGARATGCPSRRTWSPRARPKAPEPGHLHPRGGADDPGGVGAVPRPRGLMEPAPRPAATSDDSAGHRRRAAQRAALAAVAGGLGRRGDARRRRAGRRQRGERAAPSGAQTQAAGRARRVQRAAERPDRRARVARRGAADLRRRRKLESRIKDIEDAADQGRARHVERLRQPRRRPRGPRRRRSSRPRNEQHRHEHRETRTP